MKSRRFAYKWTLRRRSLRVDQIAMKGHWMMLGTAHLSETVWLS